MSAAADGRIMDDPRECDLIPLIRWDAQTLSLAEGTAAGMVPLEPPSGSVPMGFAPTECLEWGVPLEGLPGLLEHFDVRLACRDGRVCGYLLDRHQVA